MATTPRPKPRPLSPRGPEATSRALPRLLRQNAGQSFPGRRLELRSLRASRARGEATVTQGAGKGRPRTLAPPPGSPPTLPARSNRSRPLHTLHSPVPPATPSSRRPRFPGAPPSLHLRASHRASAPRLLLSSPSTRGARPPTPKLDLLASPPAHPFPPSPSLATSPSLSSSGTGEEGVRGPSGDGSSEEIFPRESRSLQKRPPGSGAPGAACPPGTGFIRDPLAGMRVGSPGWN